MHIVRTIGIGLALAAGLIGAAFAQPVGASSQGRYDRPGWGGDDRPGWNRPGWNRPPDWRRGDFVGEAGAAAIDNYYNNCNPEAEYCGGRRETPPSYRDRVYSPPLGGYSAESGSY